MGKHQEASTSRLSESTHKMSFAKANYLIIRDQKQNETWAETEKTIKQDCSYQG